MEKYEKKKTNDEIENTSWSYINYISYLLLNSNVKIWKSKLDKLIK